jgi:hypothetical protein
VPVNTKKLASVAATVVFGGGIVASCASATTGTPDAQASTETTHLMVYSINSDGPDFRAIVTGAVGDYGPGVTVLPDGRVDPGHTSELQLNLTRGSFRISIVTIDKDVIQAYQHWPSNPATCSGRIRFTAQAPIVAGSGTGTYRGITGAFSLTVTIDEVDVKPVCNGTSAFLAQVILMDGTGAVSP